MNLADWPGGPQLIDNEFRYAIGHSNRNGERVTNAG